MQAGFLTPLRVEQVASGWWRLTSPLAYYSEMLEQVIVVPEGFCTDFASVPRLPIAYWLFGSRANAPAVTHDFAYRTGIIARTTADRVFNEAMKAEGKTFLTRWPMTGAVLAFGGLVYRSRGGCLDYRGCSKRKPKAPRCEYCEHWYRDWQKCLMTLEEYKAGMEYDHHTMA